MINIKAYFSYINLLIPTNTDMLSVIKQIFHVYSSHQMKWLTLWQYQPNFLLKSFIQEYVWLADYNCSNKHQNP